MAGGRRRVLGWAFGLGMVLAVGAAAMWLREVNRLSGLPAPIRERMPSYWSIPSDTPDEVREQIDRLYSHDAGERREAIDALAEMGRDAAAAVPLLLAMLADRGVDGFAGDERPWYERLADWVFGRKAPAPKVLGPNMAAMGPIHPGADAALAEIGEA